MNDDPAKELQSIKANLLYQILGLLADHEYLNRVEELLHLYVELAETEVKLYSFWLEKQRK
jgi:hypothetical protein